MSPFCLGTGNRGEAPAAGRAERIASEVLASWRRLEVKYDAGRDAQVVLILCAVAEFVEAGEKIVHLDRAEREMTGDVRIDAATERHRERIIGSGEAEAFVARNVRHTEQHLAERREVGIATIGDARTKKIG